MASSKGSTIETKAKNGETAFEAEEALLKVDASGLGAGQDDVAKVDGFGRDHFTSLKLGLGMFLPVTLMHSLAK